MPYTPPSQQSPATSQTPSPVHSRTVSYNDQHSSVASPPRSPGPNSHLPRSSSQSYFHRPRRAPSHLAHGELSPLPDRSEGSSSLDKPGLTINTNVRQSPPPQSDAIIPPGAMISPPDSVQNSSDEEDAASKAERSQQEHKQDPRMAELEEAVRRSISLTRDGSPPAGTKDASELAALNVVANQIISSPDSTPIPASLSAGARKISHSRSSSETMLALPSSQHMSGSSAASDGSDEDDDLMIKPPLVRKKSGELVKPAIRPKSRRKPSSMPGTPTYAKAVHFNDDIAQVRHFLQVDRPIAVSAGTSPVESLDDHDEFPFGYDSDGRVSEFEIRLSNFPRESLERQTQLVRLESLALSHDHKSLVGSVAVANISFSKHVTARFTFDYWKTTSEVSAEYSNDTRKQTREDGYDVFMFSIKLSDQSNVGHKTLLLCVRYGVNGQEHWDNNSSMNFQVDFARKVKAQSTSNAQPPRSRRNSLAHRNKGRPMSLPASLDDDFSSNFDGESAIQFRGTLPGKKPLLPDTPPARRVSHHKNAQFGNRYDFGASLTAALSQAQAQLGERSGIRPRRQPETQAKPTVQVPPSMARVQPSVSGTDSPRNDTLMANKESVDSRAYQDFISKFCFFGTKGSPPITSMSSQSQGTPSGPDGANDQDGFFGSGPGPEITNETSSAKYANNALSSGFHGLMSPPQVMSPSEPQDESPGAYSNDHEAASSVKFGYPYSSENRPGFWSGSVTPPAIRG